MRMTSRSARFAAVLTFAAAGLGPAAARPSAVETALRGLSPEMLVKSACTRIVGGDCTTQQEWPWQVALYFKLNNGRKAFLCGGSLIAPNWVLSAAHCFGAESSDRAQDWTVVDDIRKLSFLDLPAEATTRAVKRVIRHEAYDPATQANDIALLELDQPLSAKTISPLMQADPALETNATTTVTGWGATRWVEAKKDKDGHFLGFVDAISKQPVKPEDFQTPDLREASLPLIDVAECKADYKSVRGSIDQRNLCAGLKEGGRDSCQGDSGGPMMAKTAEGEWRQIGVVSWGAGCAQAHLPGIYTRVSAFADWLKAKTGDAPAPQPEPTTSPAPTADAPENAAGLTIAFDKGDDVEVGQTVAYVATAQKSGYLTIFDIGPDGQLTQIFPNAASLRSPTGGANNSVIDPAHPVFVPNYKNPYAGFVVTIAEPKGEGVMAAVLSDRPLTSVDLPTAPKTYDQKSALGLIDRIRRELTRDLQVTPDGAAHPPWSFALRKYTVH